MKEEVITTINAAESALKDIHDNPEAHPDELRRWLLIHGLKLALDLREHEHASARWVNHVLTNVIEATGQNRLAWRRRCVSAARMGVGLMAEELVLDGVLEPAVDFPSAGDLDTGGGYSADFKVALYLEPAGERDDDRPSVHMHAGVGNIGTPVPAYNGRWKHITSYGSNIVGQSVLMALREASDDLLALSETYQGTRWDGHNTVGVWEHDDEAHDEALHHAIEEHFGELQSYWNAEEWFKSGGYHWREFCSLIASVDPERALGLDDDALQDLVDEVVAAVPEQDEPVSGISAYVFRCAREWLAERARGEDV